MTKIPKVLHYVWFWRWQKSESFISYIESWKKHCPNYEIKEWNEDNFDVTQNYYMKKFYDKKLFAFASDYARIKILYENGWIYLDTDVELLKNFDDLLEKDAFIWFQDIFSIWCSTIWAKKWDNILKEILEIYKTKKIRIILPNLFTKVFKKHWLKKYNNKIQKIDWFTIYPKEYFFPYAYFEKKEDMKITSNTFTIHHYDATWLPKIVTIIAFPIIWFFANNKLDK
jgi:hypothetical protein